MPSHSSSWSLVSKQNGANVVALVGLALQPVVGSIEQSFQPLQLTSMSDTVSGTVCTVLNSYYSQCLPGTASVSPPASPPPSSAPTGTGTSTAPTGLASIPASTLTQFSNFGTNPNNVAMYVYKPKKVAANPPLIVASHCMLFGNFDAEMQLAHKASQTARALLRPITKAPPLLNFQRRTDMSSFSPLLYVQAAFHLTIFDVKFIASLWNMLGCLFGRDAHTQRWK